MEKEEGKKERESLHPPPPSQRIEKLSVAVSLGGNG